MAERPRWWLIGVAALMAAIFLYQSIGLVGAIVLLVGSVAGVAGYRWYRSRNLPKAAALRCLACGETLASTARACKYCGGAAGRLIDGRAWRVQLAGVIAPKLQAANSARRRRRNSEKHTIKGQKPARGA